MHNIYILLDYKGFLFGKHSAIPYRSGCSNKLFSDLFKQRGFNPIFLNFSEIDFRKDWKDKFIIYASSEDIGYHYKDFIEDIILGLEIAGAKVLPKYKYLRANNNKVFMEILRDLDNSSNISSIESQHYGTLEELKQNIDKVKFPCVVKSAKGAMSRGVALGKDKNELMTNATKLLRSKNFRYEIKDFIRKFKHKGYIPESRHRNKIIVQNMIENLDHDYKVLIYSDKYYYLKREVRDNDFRASGSGKFSFDTSYPDGMLEFASKIFKNFDVPNLSLDICYDRNKFYLIEFQAVNFGNKTLEFSPFYYQKTNNGFKLVEEKSNIEIEYVNSICDYILRSSQ